MLDSRDLRKRREALGLDRYELARRAGVDSTTILRIENGQDPRLKTWRQIELALQHFAAQEGGSLGRR